MDRSIGSRSPLGQVVVNYQQPEVAAGVFIYIGSQQGTDDGLTKFLWCGAEEIQRDRVPGHGPLAAHAGRPCLVRITQRFHASPRHHMSLGDVPVKCIQVVRQS